MLTGAVVTHDEKPRTVARRSRTQRNQPFRKLEIEFIDPHRINAARLISVLQHRFNYALLVGFAQIRMHGEAEHFGAQCAGCGYGR